MSLLDRITSWLTPAKPLSAEMLHYQTPPEADQQYRLHLRIENDGRGLLVVNASTVLHLNQTATEYARLLILGKDEEEAAETIADRYHVNRERAKEDFNELKDHILTLATTVDLDPVTYLNMERAEPFSAETTAPYRVDLALTYVIDESGTLDPEARRRVEEELSTEGWKVALENLWNRGVPHVCFTGGEPTLRDDLVELIQYAEEQGMVSGLLTNGRKLADQAVMDELLLSGLDHVQFTLTSHLADVHDATVGVEGAWEKTDQGLKNAIAGDIYVVVHVVVTPENAEMIEETIIYLDEQDVPAVALSAPLRTAETDEEAAEMKEALERAEEAAHRHGLTLVWDLAAPYSRVNPVEVEGDLEPERVIRQYLYVEPDGDVLPAQGYNVVLGNLLSDPWHNIWDHPERKKLVERTAS